MKILSKVISLSCGLLLSLYVSAADSPGELLSSLLAEFDSFSATFDQVSASEDSRRLEQSRGTLLLSKPNRFRWIAEEPFPQHLVSDGETLWIYDPDLEQATRRTVDSRSTGVPALILNGQIEELQEEYKIRLLQDTEQNQLFELLPEQQSTMFSRIRLLFTKGVISELQMEDSLGQRTSILFADQKVNPDYEASAFTFVPPEGTDIIVENVPDQDN